MSDQRTIPKNANELPKIGDSRKKGRFVTKKQTVNFEVDSID